MNWDQAKEAMQKGMHVRRARDRRHVQIGVTKDENEVPIFDAGGEPMFLASAWTEDDKPVRVYMGSFSRCLFVPDHEHMESLDWEVEP